MVSKLPATTGFITLSLSILRWYTTQGCADPPVGISGEVLRIPGNLQTSGGFHNLRPYEPGGGCTKFKKFGMQIEIVEKIGQTCFSQF